MDHSVGQHQMAGPMLVCAEILLYPRIMAEPTWKKREQGQVSTRGYCKVFLPEPCHRDGLDRKGSGRKVLQEHRHDRYLKRDLDLCKECKYEPISSKFSFSVAPCF